MRNTFVFVVACSLLSAHGQSLAQEAKQPRVEFTVWERVLSGTLGTKPISVALTRVAGGVSGSYCYAPCSEKTRQQLQLTGTIRANTLKLTERDSASAKQVSTGRWTVNLDGDIASGNWTSADGRKTFAIHLRDTQPVPFELRLVADAMPKETDDGDDAPYVSAIRIYRQGRLAQELPTDSQGPGSVFIPSLVDVNFDGFPDLTIALSLPAGPNIPQQAWLFDPRTQRFVDAPETLQAITSPEFDNRFKTIVSQWRNGCCEHGVTTYRWRGNQLQEADTATSVQLPVLVGQKILYCYTIPEYRDGRIEFPDRVEQVGDRLTLTFDDFSGCDTAAMPTSTRDIAIWKRDAAGELKVVRTERLAWKQVDTPSGRRYCPEIPYFANGSIGRKVIGDRPEEHCSETAPRSFRSRRRDWPCSAGHVFYGWPADGDGSFGAEWLIQDLLSS